MPERTYRKRRIPGGRLAHALLLALLLLGLARCGGGGGDATDAGGSSEWNQMRWNQDHWAGSGPGGE